MPRRRTLRRDPRPVSEDGVHLFAVQLLRLNGVAGLVWFHVPNQGKRSERTAAFLKSRGMLPGVADLVVILPGGKVHFLELKRPVRGVVSPEQISFREACERNGTPYAVAASPEDVQRVLSGWGAVRPAPQARAA